MSVNDLLEYDQWRYSHIKVTGMLVVSLYGCKLQIMVSLGVFGTESHSFRNRLGLCVKKKWRFMTMLLRSYKR